MERSDVRKRREEATATQPVERLREAAGFLRARDYDPEFHALIAQWLEFIAPFARFGDGDSLHAKHALAVADQILGGW